MFKIMAVPLSGTISWLLLQKEPLQNSGLKLFPLITVHGSACRQGSLKLGLLTCQQFAGGRLVYDGFSHSADSGDCASCLPPFSRLA